MRGILRSLPDYFTPVFAGDFFAAVFLVVFRFPAIDLLTGLLVPQPIFFIVYVTLHFGARTKRLSPEDFQIAAADARESNVECLDTPLIALRTSRSCSSRRTISFSLRRPKTMCCRRRDATRSRQTETNENSTSMRSNGANGMKCEPHSYFMAGGELAIATRQECLAVEHRGSDRDTRRNQRNDPGDCSLPAKSEHDLIPITPSAGAAKHQVSQLSALNSQLFSASSAHNYIGSNVAARVSKIRQIANEGPRRNERNPSPRCIGRIPSLHPITTRINTCSLGDRAGTNNRRFPPERLAAFERVHLKSPAISSISFCPQPLSFCSTYNLLH